MLNCYIYKLFKKKQKNKKITVSYLTCRQRSSMSELLKLSPEQTELAVIHVENVFSF